MLPTSLFGYVFHVLPTMHICSFFSLQLGLIETDKDLIEIVNSDDGLDVLEAIGYRGNPHKITLLKKPDLLQ